ncbi:ABC transporter permease [Oceanimonas baumannii]|uniref:Transport permease protein n=2 Tax=Oceanimonas baumannii TaxID=129578 RepID=A0ABY2EWC8_9GAMM|nr:ABC transporter permease [Oceanimonas baumannii]TDW56967.1 capsular polysaccharide transport system permease protein [Oceanimonas baumannii]
MSTMPTRTPWQVTRSVWFAMFMREAVSRTMADRMGWFWMIFEPVAVISIIVLIRTQLRGTSQLITNADFIPWMIIGMMGFFLIREGLSRSQGAINSAQALFAYRQVQPVDPVMVRICVDGMLRTVVFVLFVAGGMLLGLHIFPDNVLLGLLGWASLLALALGFALVISVIVKLIPETGKIINMLSLPLMIISGVILPLNSLPHSILEYLMLNPIVHGLELLRAGFFEHYHMVPGTSPLYLWLWILGLNAAGLLMHLRYKERLKAK